ncbi:MAG: hypothetical protein A3A94_03610 [Candidatus Portnoybacteria bacterium RIFCSPLOWO2_01_FULL_43_11]|uniref:Xylose isomerase-like TIM barrel domain-containing protein n=4 Tax=Bacteria candidate phyla TaxID=1783234 RepID=A0A1G2FRV1_9BACT|nr:MAG: hypothetical protein A2713_01945 [candidate division WWE3 bacterium RIFCSPHIGHO2_01_FULL_35_17]OGZ37422.1 MAG: hypothetical protein A3E90_00600 [Candidatus Portnoybacteria bacterium RIFCSPHIGHO2_12_FULL_40_11]OGZ38437.1 MAG: hypothetical protein A3A94_03610 [Candidatus Portnoybacteria bacterium RIFCSPLOWO2_01_FULL_43_11]OGZ40809.1 MAG: hypothetical protein A3I20_02285 [Candidatus Portnoybacteria bacterium RIFCSPLOWO2_02_FULL_40_15]
MIRGICTPCRAVKREDVRVRLNLLQEIKGKYPIGFEIVGPIDDFFYERELIISNIKEIKRELDFLIIHSPVERENYFSGNTNLSTEKGMETLKSVYGLARMIGAEQVIVHAEVLSFTPLISERQKKKENLKENLKRLVIRPAVKLSLENMPYPLMGDVMYSYEDMVWDPFFADPFELYEFVSEIGIFMTFDTCHWGTLGFPVSLKTIVNKFKEKISHFHISDCWGHWIPGTSVFKEGLVPGDGFLGEEQFRELFSFFKNDSWNTMNYTINLEVNDSDFKNPKESRESIRRILSWLSC